MEAFHNDIKVKNKYVDRVKHHIELDNLVRGQGWDNGKGCAVGCTLENYDHSQYPIKLGIPEWLARVEDSLFEGMNLEKSKTWPKVFLESIKVGVDLERAKTPFIIIILERNLKSMDECVYDEDKNPEVKKVLDQCKSVVMDMIRCYQEGSDLTAARSAAESAWSAARSAESAAESASSAAESARSAAESAWSAAESASSAAESAASSAAESAASSAAESAASSAAESAASSAWSAAYDYFADELIKIIKSIE